MTRLEGCGFAAVLLVAGIASAQAPAGRPTETRSAANIASLMRPAARIADRPDSAFSIPERMRYWQVPGVSLAIVDSFRIVYARGFGVTEFGGSTPVDTTTLFLAGSISKPAAVRNDTTPGARWLYSGGGFTIAQLLATDVGAEPFPSLMKRLVLTPSGMVRSTYENPLPVARHREAASGHERTDTPVRGRFHTYPEMAAAGLWTTAPELARWALGLTRAYNGERGGVLSPATARLMISRQVEVGQRYGGGYFGLGVAVAGEGDSISFSHSGRDEGFVAFAQMWPRLGRGYFILMNGVSNTFMNEVRRAFAEMYGLGDARRPERRVADIDTASLASLAGRYVLQQGRDTLLFEVTSASGALMMYTVAGRRQMRLWPEAQDTFFDVNNGATFVFERDSAARNAPAKAIRFGRASDASRALRQ